MSNGVAEEEEERTQRDMGELLVGGGGRGEDGREWRGVRVLGVKRLGFRAERRRRGRVAMALRMCSTSFLPFGFGLGDLKLH